MRGAPPASPNTNNPNQIAFNPLPTALSPSASCSPSYNDFPSRAVSCHLLPARGLPVTFRLLSQAFAILRIAILR
jgi:hypothetical protein